MTDMQSNKEKSPSACLRIFKSQITILSIFDVASTLFLVVGLLIMTWGFVSVSDERESYESFISFCFSVAGQMLFLGWCGSFLYRIGSAFYRLIKSIAPYSDDLIIQRTMATYNAILGLWLIFSLVFSVGSTYTEALEFVSTPLNAIFLILFVISNCYQAIFYAQDFVEDYVHDERLKITKIVAHRVLFFAMGVACIFSILQVAL